MPLVLVTFKIFKTANQEGKFNQPIEHMSYSLLVGCSPGTEICNYPQTSIEVALGTHARVVTDHTKLEQRIESL